MPYVDCDIEFIEASEGPISEARHMLLLAIAMMDYALYAGVKDSMSPKPYCDHYIYSYFCHPGESPVRSLN